MTREEAIERLKNMAWLYGSSEREQNIEAIDMAIEALQFQDIMENMPYTATPTPEVCKKCKEYGSYKCTKCDGEIYYKADGNLISRADAIEAVGDWMYKEYGYLDLNRAERLIDILSALPSVDRPTINAELRADWLKRQYEIVLEENKRLKANKPGGEWIRWYEEIKEDTATTYIPHAKCSNCGIEQDPYTTRVINYCPNCGAKMKEKTNDK